MKEPMTLKVQHTRKRCLSPAPSEKILARSDHKQRCLVNPCTYQKSDVAVDSLCYLEQTLDFVIAASIGS
jgi:hypothetical protein